MQLCFRKFILLCVKNIYTHLSANYVHGNNISLLLVIKDGMVGNDCTCTSIDIFCLVFCRDCCQNGIFLSQNLIKTYSVVQYFILDIFFIAKFDSIEQVMINLYTKFISAFTHR